LDVIIGQWNLIIIICSAIEIGFSNVGLQLKIERDIDFQMHIFEDVRKIKTEPVKNISRYMRRLICLSRK